MDARKTSSETKIANSKSSSSTSLFSSSSYEDDDDPFELPGPYLFLQHLGDGGFGKVVKCLDKVTKQIVAVKIPFCNDKNSSHEIDVMKKLMLNDFDQHNVIKFFGWYPIKTGMALVMELLDITIDDFITKNNFTPMYLSDISTIVQQVSTALEAVHSLNLIHTDIKLDNIMLVDHCRRPFEVKLIDFGLALSKLKVKKGMYLQTACFRAPEVILGLKFSEAIDIWSLGCVMAAMVLGFLLIHVDYEFEALHQITKLLGELADHLLEDGTMTEMYFIRTEFNRWKLKTFQEYGLDVPIEQQTRGFETLDDLKKIYLETANKFEAVEQRQCYELLKAMLELDPSERIRPSEVLAHPFITMDKPSSHNRNSKWPDAQPNEFEKTKKKKRKKSTKKKKKKKKKKRIVIKKNKTFVNKKAVRKTNVDIFSLFTELLLNKSMVNIGSLDTDSVESDIGLLFSATDEENDTTNFHSENHISLSTYPPGMILVRPAAPKNVLRWEDEESAVSLQPPASDEEEEEDDITNINRKHRSPSPKIPRGVIRVQPASSKNILKLEDEERAVSLQHTATDKKRTTNIRRKYRNLSPKNLQGVNMVRPAAPRNYLKKEDEESAVRTELPKLNNNSESSVKVTESDSSDWISINSTTSDNINTKKEEEKDLEKKKNKKKNFIGCFFCLKKTCCCSCTCGDEDEEGDN